MNLFGRKLSGFAKNLVILAAIFLVASGMCGMQGIMADHGLAGDYLLPLGIVELIAMLLSAAGIVFVLIAWFVQSLYDNHSKRQASGLQKLMDSDEQNKKDDEK
jgi:hypothetical protein